MRISPLYHCIYDGWVDDRNQLYSSWSSSIDSQGLAGFKATNWIFTSKTWKKTWVSSQWEIPVVRSSISLEWDSVDQISSSQKQVTWCYMIHDLDADEFSWYFSRFPSCFYPQLRGSTGSTVGPPVSTSPPLRSTAWWRRDQSDRMARLETDWMIRGYVPSGYVKIAMENPKNKWRYRSLGKS